jgi:thioesterase domain-containing protein
MEPSALETYLRERIPLSRAMEVRVVEIGATHLRIAAPLAPNINHRDTVFGGSAAAVAMLAAWGLLYVRLDREQRPARLVIQRCSMEYLQPIDAEFAAVSTLAAGEDWSRFLAGIERKGRARIAVRVDLDSRDRRVGEFTGEFVAVRLSGSAGA